MIFYGCLKLKNLFFQLQLNAKQKQNIIFFEKS